MAKRNLPPNWYDVYPQGSKQGDEEQAFFIALIRNPKWTFRSTAQLAKECNLSKERIEKLINKYHKRGMVYQNPVNEDQWGYWERNQNLLPEIDDNLANSDHKDRSYTIFYDMIEKIFSKEKSFSTKEIVNKEIKHWPLDVFNFVEKSADPINQKDFWLPLR